MCSLYHMASTKTNTQFAARVQSVCDMHASLKSQCVWHAVVHQPCSSSKSYDHPRSCKTPKLCKAICALCSRRWWLGKEKITLLRRQNIGARCCNCSVLPGVPAHTAALRPDTGLCRTAPPSPGQPQQKKVIQALGAQVLLVFLHTVTPLQP